MDKARHLRACEGMGVLIAVGSVAMGCLVR